MNRVVVEKVKKLIKKVAEDKAVCSVGSQEVKQEQLFDQYQQVQQGLKAAS